MKQMGLNSVSSWWHNHTEGNMASDFKRLASLWGSVHSGLTLTKIEGKSVGRDGGREGVRSHRL